MIKANDLLRIHSNLTARIDAIELRHGKDGKDGSNGKDGKDGRDGQSIAGAAGRDGKAGRDGVDGTSYEAPEELLMDELLPRGDASSHTVNHGVQGTGELRTRLDDLEASTTAYHLITTAQTLELGTTLVDSAGAISVTLPSAVAGSRIVLKSLDGGVVSIVGTVDEATNKTISSQYGTLSLISDGTNWWIV